MLHISHENNIRRSVHRRPLGPPTPCIVSLLFYSKISIEPVTNLSSHSPRDSDESISAKIVKMNRNAIAGLAMITLLANISSAASVHANARLGWYNAEAVSEGSCGVPILNTDFVRCLRSEALNSQCLLLSILFSRLSL
jgi:hypothetical protein